MPDFVFSKRTNWSTQNNPLSDLLENLQSKSVEILDLTESNPTRCGFDYPKTWMQALSEGHNLLYTPQAKGMAQARRAIQEYYRQRNIEISDERMVLTSSTSEGYSFLLKLLTNPGDHVLIPKPSYPLFQFLLEMHDVAFDYYPLVYDGSAWSINQKAFKDLMTPKTRVVIVVNPNNPTGSYLNSKDQNFLNEQCQKNTVSIICDEVFLDYPVENLNPARSLISNAVVPTFVLSGISKILGLPQMKLSWIVANGPQKAVEEAIQRLEIIADTYLSVNTPVQNALSSWLLDSSSIQKQILDRVRGNLEILHRSQLKVLAVEGGWYALIQAPSIKSEEQFVLSLLEQDHVLVHPGYFFDFEAEGYLIVSLLPNPKTFAKAVERIARKIK